MREEEQIIASPVGRRFRFSFSLRTLFGAITLFAVCMSYPLHWIKQRHETLADRKRVMFHPSDPELRECLERIGGAKFPDAPWPLGLFGEKGIPLIDAFVLPHDVATEEGRLRRLFPEAEVTVFSDEPPAQGSNKSVEPYHYPNPPVSDDPFAEPPPRADRRADAVNTSSP